PHLTHTAPEHKPVRRCSPAVSGGAAQRVSRTQSLAGCRSAAGGAERAAPGRVSVLDLVPVGEDLVEAERELFGLVFVAQCRQGLAGWPLQWVEPDLGRAAGMVWGGPPRVIPVGGQQ